MKFIRCDKQDDPFFSGAQLKDGSAPEGVYEYASAIQAPSDVVTMRFVVIGTGRGRVLVQVNRKNRTINGMSPGDSTVFKRLDEVLVIDFKERR